MKKIVTPMNFVRGSEPRLYIDLFGTTKKELELTEKYGLKTTYLLQYDAFTKKEYQELFLKENSLVEVGLWLELCQDLIETVGLKWRGREGYDWDYFLEVDNLLGYSDDEKILIIDEIFERFFSVFGYYPKTVGSWLLDPFSLNYIVKKYNIVCHCICREQWGTDGITLFGGYYNQAYYPSRNNILCPSSKEKGIPVPTFRLLGCDPIYQYDSQLTSTCGDVFTLEPVYWIDDKTGKPSPIGGHNEQWINWYFGSLYKYNYGLSFAYSQVGQENSFGWERINGGLIRQLEQIKTLVENGEVEAMFLKDAGLWFSNNFDKSPASTQVALSDYENNPIKSVWYYCVNYRMNLYSDEKGVRIRDMFIYNENYTSRYGNGVILKTHDAIHDNLPIMNGLKWTQYPRYAGIYFCNKRGERIKLLDFEYNEKDSISNSIIKYNDGEIRISLFENKICVQSNTPFCLEYDYVDLLEDESISIKTDKTVRFTKREFEYEITLSKGTIVGNKIYSEEGEISINF